MPTIVLLIVFIVVVVLLAKSFQNAQREPTPTRLRSRPGPRPRKPRPRRQVKPIDQEKLSEHVKKLRQAVDNDLISQEEAVASIVRHTDGQLTAEEAAKRLRSHDAA